MTSNEPQGQKDIKSPTVVNSATDSDSGATPTESQVHDEQHTRTFSPKKENRNHEYNNKHFNDQLKDNGYYGKPHYSNYNQRSPKKDNRKLEKKTAKQCSFQFHQLKS